MGHLWWQALVHTHPPYSAISLRVAPRKVAGCMAVSSSVAPEVGSLRSLWGQHFRSYARPCPNDCRLSHGAKAAWTPHQSEDLRITGGMAQILCVRLSRNSRNDPLPTNDPYVLPWEGHLLLTVRRLSLLIHHTCQFDSSTGSKKQKWQT